MTKHDAEVISIARQRAARSSQDVSGTPARQRCTATTQTGRPCRNYAVDEGRCRVHAARHVEVREVHDSPEGHGAREVDEAAATRDAAATREAAATRDERPSRGHRRDDAWEKAMEEMSARGFGPPVDAFRVLRDVVEDGWDDRWLESLRGMGAFLRRRLTGEYVVDDFGFDEELTTRVLLPLLRPLHRYYWRVASSGAEHLPLEGAAVLAANHAGTVPVDALITRLDVFDQTSRHARELGADLLFRTPFAGEFARKTGATRASGDDADRLLAAGELVAVWPEGFKGLGKPWAERYKLQRFGRGGFAETAMRARVPIIPTAIVGSEEIYPLLFDLRIVARSLGLPYFPIVAQFFALPLIGPFALLPLPSKWIIEYGEPIDTSAYPAGAADDPMTVFELSDRVRGTIQEMLERNLMGRRSILT